METTLQKKKIAGTRQKPQGSPPWYVVPRGMLAKTDSPCQPLNTVSASAGTPSPPSNSSFCCLDDVAKASSALVLPIPFLGHHQPGLRGRESYHMQQSLAAALLRAPGHPHSKLWGSMASPNGTSPVSVDLANG
ncbi:hypothetical protein DHEL01_v209979 [Diaporthe helianthi]|uniref:Uncharacterized protein n=1 Tax=Diaporthe helianthi TaxID=158607 RepID=A0A2P5HN21_DIAHE|nr:hypothetical protein DHEL01_v209979 [Diaporthe helianthi]